MKSKLLSTLLSLCVLCSPVPIALAGGSYEVGMLVARKKDTKEYNSRLSFDDASFRVVSKKVPTLAKEMRYADVKAADYSYSKKPMWKTGVTTALIGGLFVIPLVFAVPFFFIKTKSHWLTVRTEKDFVVLKLEGDNFRQVRSEFETHGVKIETITETSDKKEKDK